MTARLVTLCRSLLFAVIAAGFATSAYADVQVSAVYPPGSVIFGLTYPQWSAAWQKWANSLPAFANPLFDTADCSAGQSAPVWFLGGRFCSTEDPNCQAKPQERSCTVPFGTALYFPVLNFACLNVEAANGLCGEAGPNITDIRKFLSDNMSQATGLRVFLDRREIRDVASFRAQSNVYSTALPEDNLFEAIGEPSVKAGVYWGADDGYYLMLRPLSVGQHTLRFEGTLPQYNFTINFTYYLTVK